MTPIFRWTVGNVTRQGMEILEESVFRAMKVYGDDAFEWMICHNGLTDEMKTQLRFIVQQRPIRLVEQSWDDCPIPDNHWTPIRPDGRIEVDGKKCGGTLWKVCPARVDVNRHEIVMDNDIVLLKRVRAIDEFLECEYKTLILEEPIRFYGRYDFIVDRDDRLNSGLIGFPPGYDFGSELLSNWERYGRLKYLTQADEQGLLMYTLSQQPNIRITKYDIRELLAKQGPDYTGEEEGLHFVQANRTVTGHRSWIKYKDELMNKVKLL